MELKKFKFRPEVAWPFVLAVTITWCSGYPAELPEVGWFQIDKIGHFGLYGALATAIARIPALKHWPGIGAWWALMLASAYGMGDEFRQSLTQGIRTPDWHDWLADTLGAITAVSLYLHWNWYRRLMETPVLKKRAKPQAAVAQTEGATKGAEVTKGGST
jgi:VanZ family protein